MSNPVFLDRAKKNTTVSLLGNGQLDKPFMLKFADPKLLTIAVLSSALFVAGCATKPVYQSNAGPTIQTNAQGVPNYYKVKSGDTVSQIAQRYGLNYRRIGAINRLDSRYTIYAGQWLKLWEGAGNTYTNQPRPTQTVNPQYGNNGYTNTQPVRNPAPVTPPQNTVNSNKGFGYPTTNPVVKNFDANKGNMGMWFSGRVGDPVVASKGGQVLYAGNGLPEYGNLIMIRHDDTYITVYAHNNDLLVKEGDQVQSGQRIATMGSSGQTSQVGLQFQVRENGTPVDPRAVLGL